MRSFRNIVLIGGIVLLTAVALHNIYYRQLTSPTFATPHFADDTLTAEEEAVFVATHPLTSSVLTVEELQKRVASDPALAAFYLAQGFNVDCARSITMTSSRIAVTSWRKGPNFGYAITPALVSAGETVFTSCGSPAVFVRAKCGNIMLLWPESQESLETSELLPSDLAPAAEIPPTIALVPPSTASVPPEGSQPPTESPQPPGSPVFCCGGTVPNMPPVSVSEPSTLGLFCAGMIVLIIGFKIGQICK